MKSDKMVALVLETDRHYIKLFGELIILHLVGEIERAESIKDAREYLQSSRSDLILIDLDYPSEGQEDALSFVESLKMQTATKDIPIVAVSSDPSLEGEARSSGCSAFFCKAGWKTGDILATIQGLL